MSESTVSEKASVLDELISESEHRIARLRVQIEGEERVAALLHEKRLGISGPIRRERLTNQELDDEPKSVADKVARALLELGRPTKAYKITERLIAAGEKTTAKRGLGPMVLSALRRRKDLFRKVSRGKYGLMEWGVGEERRPA